MSVHDKTDIAERNRLDEELAGDCERLAKLLRTRVRHRGMSTEKRDIHSHIRSAACHVLRAIAMSGEF